jgi:hypothetical protein
VAVELVTEEAVLGIIDDWWRHAPAGPAPLKAAQITLRLHPQIHRAADAAMLVLQVVGRIRDLARRGRVRALPDGSAVLSYSPLPSRPAAPSRSRDLTATVGVMAPLPTWGTVPRLADPTIGPRPVAPRPAAAAFAVSWRPPVTSPLVGPAQRARRADLSPHSRRLIIRVAVVVFLLITTAVVGTVGHLIDLPIRQQGVLNCSDAGHASSTLPQCGGSGRP